MTILSVFYFSRWRSRLSHREGLGSEFSDLKKSRSDDSNIKRATPLIGQPEAVFRRNNVAVSGRPNAAETMIFAHGFGCDQNMWRFVAPAFEADYRVVLFDYVGSGKSDVTAYDPKRYDSLDGYASDLLDVCEALDLHEAIFVGHSVSSIIGVLASIREPKRFSRLILVSPSPRYINDGAGYIGGFERADIEGLLSVMEKNYLGWAGFLAPVVMKNPDRPELTAELEQSFCSTDPTAARSFAQITFLSDHRSDLPKVMAPSLIVQCSDDAIAPVSVGTYMYQHLRGSTLAILDAMGHCPHMSHPADTVRLIKNYLDAAAAASV